MNTTQSTNATGYFSRNAIEGDLVHLASQARSGKTKNRAAVLNTIKKAFEALNAGKFSTARDLYQRASQKACG